MGKLFRLEQKVSKYYRTQAHKDVVEKQIFMDFFLKIPIESLKKLINFQEIDFENKELWKDYDKQEMLSQLRDENVVKYTCELYIGRSENLEKIVDEFSRGFGFWLLITDFAKPPNNYSSGDLLKIYKETHNL